MPRLGSLGRELGLDLQGDPSLEVRGVAEPAAAGPDEIAVLTDPGRLAEAEASRAGALLLTRTAPLPHDPRPQIVCDDPSAALGALLRALSPEEDAPGVGVSERAVVDPAAQVEGDAWIGPLAVVGPGARVGAQSGVARDVPEGESVMGYPAVGHRGWKRTVATLSLLARSKKET